MPVFIIDNSRYPVITFIIIALEAWLFVSTLSFESFKLSASVRIFKARHFSPQFPLLLTSCTSPTKLLLTDTESFLLRRLMDRL